MGNSFVGLPPDGAGKKLHAQSHEVNGNTVYNQILTVGDANNYDNLQRVDEYGSSYVRFEGGGFDFDTFGSAKVSEQMALGVYMHSISALDDKFTSNITGNAQYTYIPNEKCVRLSVTSDASDKITRTTDKYHRYTAGISNFVVMTTAIGDSGKDGVTRRWGYFDDENGLYFELKDHSFNVVQRSSVTGTVIEQRVEQSNFSDDKLDGTGISKMNIDLSKSNIFWIDFQWLGVGVTRFGVFDTNGRKILIHKFSNANANPSIYMKTASLPIRVEMENTALTASGSEMKLFNAAVFQNNSIYQPMKKFQGSGLQYVNVANGGFQHVVSIRPSLVSSNGDVNRTILLPHMVNYSTTEPCLVLVTKDTIFSNSGLETWNTPLGNNEPQSEMSTDATIDFTVEANKGSVIIAQFIDGTGSINLDNYFGCSKECLTLDADGNQTHNVTVSIRPLNFSAPFDVVMGINWGEVHL